MQRQSRYIYYTQRRCIISIFCRESCGMNVDTLVGYKADTCTSRSPRARGDVMSVDTRFLWYSNYFRLLLLPLLSPAGLQDPVRRASSPPPGGDQFTLALFSALIVIYRCRGYILCGDRISDIIFPRNDDDAAIQARQDDDLCDLGRPGLGESYTRVLPAAGFVVHLVIVRKHFRRTLRSDHSCLMSVFVSSRDC